VIEDAAGPSGVRPCPAWRVRTWCIGNRVSVVARSRPEELTVASRSRVAFQAHERPALDARGKQHFLNFLPLPHGQGSFRPTPLNGLMAGALFAIVAVRLGRHPW
jgi:hypothetical protein